MKTLGKLFKKLTINALLLTGAASLHAESEPNNSYTTATVLSINTSSSGALSDSDQVDWWKVTVGQDGKLIINTTADGDLDIDLFLFDINGTTQIAKFDTSLGHNEATHFDNLMPGTYFIKALGYSGSGNYTITSVFTAASLANDSLANANASTATALTPNASSSGHLGYYSDGKYDVHDWWKVTLPKDGKLIINTTSTAGIDIDLMLYDIDGKTKIASYDSSSGVREATHYNNLMQGTYYIDALCFKGYGSYTISSNYAATALDNDVEVNDESLKALTLSMGVRASGHLGYYQKEYTDKVDWWKVAINKDGRLVINTTSDAGLDIDLFLYDINGKTQIASYDSSQGINEATHYSNLMPGTYFVEAKVYSGYGWYTIAAAFTDALYENDSQGNDQLSGATPLNFGPTVSGHIGYYSNGFEDEDDWWSFTLPTKDSVKIFVESTSVTDILDIRMFKDPDHTETYLRSGRLDQYEIIEDLMPAGTYYIKVYKYDKGFGSYKLTLSRKKVATTITDARLQVADVHLYPNPVSDEANLHFNLQNGGNYEITVVDPLGQTVSKVYDGLLTTGEQSFSIHADQLAKGMYWCKIQSENSVVMKPMMIHH